MYRRTLIMLAVLSLSVVGLAEARTYTTGAHSGRGKGTMHGSATKNEVLNNVVKMNADGSRTALCCCGAEFTVTDNSPTTEHNGTQFYLCGDGCKQMTEKASKEEMAKTMKAWHEKYRAQHLASNVVTKDGKQMATCLCGKTFEVTANSPSVTENGIKTYLCSDACSTNLHGMSAADRMQKELGELQAMASPDEKKN